MTENNICNTYLESDLDVSIRSVAIMKLLLRLNKQKARKK